MVDNHDNITNKEEHKEELKKEHAATTNNSDDELSIDFSKIKNKLTGWFKSETKPEPHTDSHSEPKSISKGSEDELS
ncbi:hypothetical protein HZC30_04080, partial [Candidatus Woesearchaeota archaeon]|nr:hypothetical protein [Candidatus Woesearchaeota archaeon]